MILLMHNNIAFAYDFHDKKYRIGSRLFPKSHQLFAGLNVNIKI